jgi:hypothetical protein
MLPRGLRLAAPELERPPQPRVLLVQLELPVAPLDQERAQVQLTQAGALEWIFRRCLRVCLRKRWRI